VLAVHLGGDTADCSSFSPGEEQLDIRVAEEGVVLRRKALLFDHKEWRDPVRIALVETPWQVDELVEVALRPNGDDLNVDGGGRARR
jgi:hypothetical protein